MSAHRVTFLLLGNEDAIRRCVRRMLDWAEFTEVDFKLVPATEDELVERECLIRILEAARARHATAQPPMCCGAPMRRAAFPGWICNGGVDPAEGKGCERHEAPDGVRTSGPWWKEPLGFSQRVRERCEGRK